MADEANRHRRHQTFSVGDWVKLDAAYLPWGDQPARKLRDRFIGPLQVVAVISPVAYKLGLPPALSKLHPVFHVEKLLPWCQDSEHPDHECLQTKTFHPPGDFVEGDDWYEISHIRAVKIGRDPELDRDTVLFQVRWAAPFDSAVHDTWEPVRLLKGRDALRIFFTSDIWAKFRSTRRYTAFYTATRARLPKLDELKPSTT